MLVSWSPNKDSVFIEYIINDVKRSTIVYIVSAHGNYGDRFQFFCTASQKPCRSVYFNGFQFVHQSAHHEFSGRGPSPAQRKHDQAATKLARLAGVDGLGRARGAKRARLIEELKGERLFKNVTDVVSEERARLEMQILRAAKRKASVIKDGPLSTKSGWSEPRSLSPYDQVPDMEATPWWDKPARALPKAVPPIAISSRPAIDLPTILAAAKALQSPVFTVLLTWQCAELWWFQCTLTVDLRDEVRKSLLINGSSGNGNHHETRSALIIQGTDGKHRLECPMTGQIVDTLFLRNGELGCRTALKLVYPRKKSDKPVRQPKPEAEVKAAVAAASKRLGLTPNTELGELSDHIRLKAEAQAWLQIVQRALNGDFQAQKYVLAKLGFGRPDIRSPVVLYGEERMRVLKEFDVLS